ncbi:MAG: SLC41A family transporter [Candidatus Saccharimonadales bacterium]
MRLTNFRTHVQALKDSASTFDNHWHYLYRRHARWHGVSNKQIIISQIFTVVASVAAGLLLDITKEGLAVLVGGLLLLPGIIDLAASLTGAMSAKIHHRLDTTDVPAWLVVVNAVLFAMFVGILAGAMVGVAGGVIGVLFFGAAFSKMVLLAVVSMGIIGFISYPLMALFVLLLRRLGINPDNVAGPVENSVVDMVAIVVVAGVARLLV